MRYRTAIAGAAALVLIACTKPPLDDQQKTAIADSLGQFVAGPFLAAFDNGNVDTILALYAPGQDIQSAMNGKIFANRDSIVQNVRAEYGPSAVRYLYTLAAPQIAVLDRNAAVYTTMVAATVKDSAGAGTPMRFAWTGVFVRMDGHWKLQAEHGSSVPGPAAPATARTARPGR